MTREQKKVGNRITDIVVALLFVSAAFLFGTSYLFRQSADGSFLMYRAGQLGLVSDKWAKDHLLDVVYFKQLADGSWEYRVPRPLIGSASIPGLVAIHTSQDLGALCATSDPNGNMGCLRTKYAGKPLN